MAATVASPDGRIVVSIDVSEDGRPGYAVSFDEEEIVRPSVLGLVFRGGPNLDTGLSIVDESTASSDTTWEQPWGERRLVRDHYNELLVTFAASEPARRFAVRFRVHNDGLGFRYEVPEQDAFGKVTIDDELTEFRLPVDAMAWWTPARGFNRYEYHTRKLPVIDITLANTPATFLLADGTHVSLHEAALVDYAGYVLEQRDHGVLKTNLTPRSDGAKVKTTAPFVTPWRTIQVAPEATGLLNSSLILNLNEPNKLGDVSWVEPGKYIGIWWAMHLGLRTWGSGPTHGATTEEAKRYIDFAAEHGFSGVLVEGWNTGWDGNWIENGAVFSFTESYPDFDLEDVAAYALEKGTRLVGHHETSGHISNYEAQMDDAFELYGSVGVRQVKTGYVAHGGNLQRVDENGELIKEWHDGQVAVDHFIRVLESAAKHKISINTHEPVKATGLRRTYPNWITREGARGQEYNSAWPLPNRVDHNVNLVYTRVLGGPIDFTPGIFDLQHQGADSNRRVQSTLAHQLALYVVLYSPVQMAADLPENYLERPDAFQFIKDVPADWEESIAVAGEVGDYVVFARKDRNSDDWYVGAITDETSRRVEVPLGFLDEGRRYTATIYRDGDDAHWESQPLSLAIERESVNSATTLTLPLAAGGGAAVRIAAESSVYSDRSFAFPGGRYKALVLSYDDGPSQDEQFVEMLNRHGLKGTFNINSGRLGQEAGWMTELIGNPGEYVEAEDLGELYAGHEVAAHTVNHPYLSQLDTAAVEEEIGNDIETLETLTGLPVESFAYPFGEFDDRIVAAAARSGLTNARTIEDTRGFDLPDDLLRWHPTSHHTGAPELIDEFHAIDDRPALFMIWGHSWEFDGGTPDNSWDVAEQMCAALSGRDDTWYAGAGEVAEYIAAVRGLRRVNGQWLNDSHLPVWVREDRKFIEISARD